MASFGEIYRVGDGVVKTLALLAAGVWAIFQYHQHIEDQRIQTVLNYQKELRTEPLFDPWKVIEISNVTETVDQDAALNSGPDAWITYSFKLGARRRNDFEIISAFYDNITACADENLCDEDMTVRLFGRDAELLYTFYGAYIECERAVSGDKSYASGIIAIRQKYILESKHKVGNLLHVSPDQCATLAK